VDKKTAERRFFAPYGRGGATKAERQDRVWSILKIFVAPLQKFFKI